MCGKLFPKLHIDNIFHPTFFKLLIFVLSWNLGLSIFEVDIYQFKILFADIFATETGHFGHFNSSNFRPF